MNKKFIVSFAFAIMLFQFVGFCLYDGITGWKPKTETNNSVDYSILREHLSNWYFLNFWTSWTLTFSLVTGFLSMWLWKYKIYRNILFCSITYLIFNLFAMTKYRWESFILEPFGSYKTLSCHLAFPITAFVVLFWIRKDIVLNIQIMFICGFYLTLYLLVNIIIYYSITYVDENGILKHIKIYEFIDWNEKVMCFNTKNISWRIIINSGILLISPIAGVVIFFVFKFIYKVKFERIWWTKQNHFDIEFKQQN